MFGKPFHIAIVVVFLASMAVPTFAQRAAKDSTKAIDRPISAYVFGGIGGFIPMGESYRINYSTNLGGLPIEVTGGVLFPVTEAIFTPITFRYERREANFIAGTSIAVLSIEPGIRVYFEKQREKDFRVFGGIEALIAQASVMGTYDASPDGNSITPEPAAKDYFDLGLGFDIGLVYPLTATTALDGTVHTAIYFSSSVASGGLGNIGGVSLTVAYRFGF
jgi:hypothetical protein